MNGRRLISLNARALPKAFHAVKEGTVSRREFVKTASAAIGATMAGRVLSSNASRLAGNLPGPADASDAVPVGMTDACAPWNLPPCCAGEARRRC
jgi:hypothetical protein